MVLKPQGQKNQFLLRKTNNSRAPGGRKTNFYFIKIGFSSKNQKKPSIKPNKPKKQILVTNLGAEIRKFSLEKQMIL